MPAEHTLQHEFDLLGFCKDQHAAGVLVQSVHDEESLPAIALLEVLAQIEISGLLPLICRCYRKQTFGLLYYEDVVVFEQYFQTAWQPGWRSAWADLQDISGANLPRSQVAGLTVYADASLRKHLAQSPIGSPWNEEPKNL
jgi:hypothetical protein